MKVNQDRLIKTFVDLVKIDSESGEEQEVINYLQKIMVDFGFNTVIDETGNLICSNSSNPKLLLAAHTDTVIPGKNIHPIIEGNVIKTDGTTILGTDDKANIAIILEILQVIKESNLEVSMEVIFTVGEEIGLVGSKNLDYTKIKSKVGLNLDGETGEIDTAEASIMVFDIEIIGKAAHSGMAPEKGINAIKIAAEAISVLDLGKIDEETTANIGLIQGGTAINTVPEKVSIKAEVRSRSEEKFNYQIAIIKETFEQITEKYGGTVEIKSEQTAFAYKVPVDDKLITVLKNSFVKNGVKPGLMEINAACDANNFSRNGIKCVTTGGFGKNYHTTSEYLEIDRLALGAESILDAVLELTK